MPHARTVYASAPASSEYAEQVALFAWIAWLEGRLPGLDTAYAVPNSGLRHKAVAAQMKASGQRAGVWDIHLPVARQGYIGLWIEMKYGRNGLTILQVLWRDKMEAAGHVCQVHYDWQSAARGLVLYLGGKPEEYGL